MGAADGLRLDHGLDCGSGEAGGRRLWKRRVFFCGTCSQDFMKITRITTKKRGRGAAQRHVCVVEVDGDLWNELEAETLVKENLRTGQRVNEERLNEIRRADEVLKAGWEGRKRTALRPRARRDLHRRLKVKGFEEGAVEQALDRLEETGAVNDREVAARHVRRRMREGGYGRARMRDELLAEGIAPSVAEQMLDKYLEGYDEAAACRALIEKRAARYEPLSELKNRRRLESLLVRRGFHPEVIRSALGEFIPEGSDV